MRSAAEGWFGGGPGLVPAQALPLPIRRSPLLAYRWADTERALVGLLDVTGADHAVLRYTDPVRGGNVMPTMRCEITRVLAGASTETVRQTGGRVLCAPHGTGEIEIDAQRFDIEPGDILAVPSWTTWAVRAGTEMDLFSTSDAPVLEVPGLMRTENLPSGRPGPGADVRFGSDAIHVAGGSG